MQAIYAKWVPSIKPLTDYILIWKIVVAFIIVLVLLLLWIARVRRLNRKIKVSKTEAQATNKILQALQSDLEQLVLKRTAELNSSGQKAPGAEANSSKNKVPGLVENPGNDYFFFQYDREGTFTYMSPSITNLLGYTEDEFMTHYHEYLTDNPINLKIDEYTKQSTQGMPHPPYQLEIYDAQRNIHWLEVKDTPVYDENGNCIGVDGFVHDITESRQTDEGLITLTCNEESSEQKSDQDEKNYKNPVKSSSAKQACPRCGDEKTRRSSARKGDGILRILFYNAYRCRECYYRFWVVNPVRLVLAGAMILIIAIFVGVLPFSSSE